MAVNIKMDLQEMGWAVELNSYGSGMEKVAGCCVCCNELSGLTKRREFRD
jgi:hypothetical protein